MTSQDERERKYEETRRIREELGMDAPQEMPTHDINIPWIYQWAPISHYYGDTVRQLLVAAAVLMLIAAPFYTDDLHVEMPFIIVACLVLVGVSALTSPIKQNIMSADAVVSGVGLVIFEYWAIHGYTSESAIQFIIRQVLALVFLFAFYYSTKTLRSMILKQVGRKDAPLVTAMDLGPEDGEAFLAARADKRQALKELNEYEKLEYTD